CPPSEPALSGAAGRGTAVHRHAAAGAARDHAGALRLPHRRLPRRLRGGAHHRRILPRARRLPGLPVRWRHHGAIAVGADAAGRAVADRPHAIAVIERLDAFMARANAAYYAARDPFADFTTGPEISQVFGELLGLWAAVVWQQMGEPAPILLAEAGPGRGTLMADALRAIGKTVPGFRVALRLHLVETSPRLRALQAERLAEAIWHNDVAELPEGPLLLLANEFLDALPIRQFVRCGTGWTERHVQDGSF